MVLAVIPARLGSERLQRKPLQMLAGRPLIQRVWERASAFSVLDCAVIATDSEEIVRVCEGFGAHVVMTSDQHTSGTERCAEVATMPPYAGYDVIVNIQGDEPFMTAEAVAGSVAMVRAGFDIGTVAAPIQSLDAWRDPSVVKIARAASGRALYFSRAPIPHMRGGEPDSSALAATDFLRHIGVYAYTRNALMKWVALPPSTLESFEKLEQLRPLAAGMAIGVGIVSEGFGGIDTPEDLARAEQILRGN